MYLLVISKHYEWRLSETGEECSDKSRCYNATFLALGTSGVGKWTEVCSTLRGVEKQIFFLISNFRRVLNVVCFLLGCSQASVV
jgi:hypothetical protein